MGERPIKFSAKSLPARLKLAPATGIITGKDTTPVGPGRDAPGPFTCSPAETEFTLNLGDLGLKGSHKVRDLWRQQVLGEFTERYEVSVRRHGAALVRVW